ncbi:hypothetical protein GWI33_006017 [Rhynchophorus ferrugineus]|uniref:glutathione transferase n=1 Tax=Rhynchophorus ferrugineus TaxID=354439 RepID=A0A834IWG6_RHYFE|nr:hypothetical protein GWI33_006017 [Rhynchophorus ferrugineus]
MAPKYKLIYFDFTGAAEPIRYIFAYGNQEFEDFRVPRDKWPEFKSSTPFGKLPILEVDGKQVPQSISIARYLASKFNLTGKDEWEALQCDYLVDTLGDLKQEAVKAFFEPDPEKAEVLKKKVLEEVFPFYLGKFDKIIKDNGGFTVGSQITWSDLVFAASLSDFENHISSKSDLLKPYPAITALLNKIHTLPSIKAWLETRPPIKPLQPLKR